jgi:hypothetical protein
MKSKIVFERSKIKGKYQVLCGKCNLQKGGSFDYTNPQVRAYLKIFIENLQDIIKIYE